MSGIDEGEYMTTIIIILAIWGIYRLLKGTAERRQAERAERERQRIREEQAAQRREIAEMRERAKAETRRQIEAEKARIAWQKRQDQINRDAAKERERLAKEQAKQEEALAKHEKRIADLEHRMTEAEAELLNDQARLDHYTAKLSVLDEQLNKVSYDIEYYRLAQNVDAETKAKAEYAKLKDKIFGFEEKVRACEKRMAKAQYTIAMAKREIES